MRSARPWSRSAARRSTSRCRGRSDGWSISCPRRSAPRCTRRSRSLTSARSPTTHGVRWEPQWGGGKLVEELFEATVEAGIVAPVFVTGHPVEVSPLARLDRTDPWLTERFELFCDSRELANGYSELNDPVEQRSRFEAEQSAKDAGDLEAGTVDEDYLRALEYGMPPTGGLGVGIDRLVMMLAGVETIRDVILFPALRPERAGPTAPRVQRAGPAGDGSEA